MKLCKGLALPEAEVDDEANGKELTTVTGDFPPAGVVSDVALG